MAKPRRLIWPPLRLLRESLTYVPWQCLRNAVSANIVLACLSQVSANQLCDLAEKSERPPSAVVHKKKCQNMKRERLSKARHTVTALRAL